MNTYRIVCPSAKSANVLVAYLTSEDQTAIWYSLGRKAVVVAHAKPKLMDAALAFANAGLVASEAV